MANSNRYIKSDLHCHILPSMDDGAKDVTVSNELLSMEAADGISQIVFTPHFYPDRMSLDDFLLNRSKSFEALKTNCENRGIDFKVGAEVHMNPALNELDFSKLCFSDTDFLLLEWPHSAFPLWGEDIVENMLSEGITPIFAHIERYEYFFSNLDNIEQFIDMGCLCQMNAETVIYPQAQKYVLNLIKQNYVHVLSSDAHSVKNRPPKLGEAYEIIEKKLGSATLERLLSNADNVFCGHSIKSSKVMRKKLFSFMR